MAGYTAADEGEYLGADSMPDPALLSLFPPLPEGAPAFVLSQAGGAMGGATGGDRASLRLRPVDVEIIKATAAANPRTIVVVVTAGAVITEEWRHDVPALVVGWYSGAEGGHALADALTGRADASGRLPYSIPTSEDHLPFFDRDATSIVYDRWYGQRLLDRDGHAAAFPLGFGLSYTSFRIHSVSPSPIEGESFDAIVRVTNTGRRAGRHVVQLYATVDAEDFPARVLLGFSPVELEPGETAEIVVAGSVRPLQRWTEGGFVPAAAVATLEASSYSGDPASVTAPLPLSLP